MTEGELKQLEAAYKNDVSLEQVKQALIDGGQEQGIPQVEDFYKKKKDFGVEDSVSTSVDSYSLSNLPVSIAAQQLPDNFYEQAEANPSLAKRNGIVEDILGTVSNDPSEDKSTVMVVDENPNELQRLWNRGFSRGRLASEMVATYPDLENIAYFNAILERDAPKESDVLKLNQDTHPIASFVLDVMTMLPESLFSSFSAPEITVPAALTGGAAGSAIPFFGTVGGALAGFFGTGSGATEYTGSFFEALQESGVDITDEDQLRDVLFKQTPEGEAKLKEAKEKGLEKGIPVGLLDGITAGRGGQFIKSAMKKGTSLTTATAKEIGFDSALGAGGEAIGTAAQGKDINMREVLLEAAAGPFTGAPGAIYNYYATQALTPGERNYSKWAGTQDSDMLNKSMAVSLAVDNGRIGILDTKIKDIKKILKKPDQDRTVTKALQRDLNQLTNQKYTSLLEIQQQLVGLDEKIFAQAAELTQSIFQNVAVLKNNRDNKDFGPTEKAAVENQLDELGVALNKLINENATSRQATGLSAGSTTDEEALQEKSGELKSEEVTEKIYKDFVDTGNVSEGVISFIADKVINNEVLTDQERAIYSEKGREIEAKIKIKAEEKINSTASNIIKDRQPNRDIEVDTLEESRNRFKNDGYLNLFDPRDMAVLFGEMENLSPGDRVEVQKMILASEAFKSLNPNADTFIIGFTEDGYKKGAKASGFGNVEGTAGVTSTTKADGTRGVGNKIIQLLGNKIQRKKSDRIAYKTAYHEVMHQVFADYFDSNPVDFNQFRKLIVNRLKRSDVKELNEFAERYKERSGGAYKSEEFMVELAAKIGGRQIEFSPSFLEEIRAFLNNIIRKITNNRVQLFEDAGLAKDIEGYLTGVTEAIRTGSDLRKVKTAERLKSDRFKRTSERVDVNIDPETQEETFRVTESRNVEGRPDPESYERQKDILEPITEWIRSKSNITLKDFEKKLGTRLRGADRKVVQAQEVATSMIEPIKNRLYLASLRIKKAVSKLSQEDQKRILDLTNEYYFSKSSEAQTKALQEIILENENIAQDIQLLKFLLEDQQKKILNNPAFDSLSEDLLQTIKDSVGEYGVRSYRIFTDPNFKIDPEQRKIAKEDLIQQKLFELREKILDGDEEAIAAIREYFETDPNLKEIMDQIERDPTGEFDTVGAIAITEYLNSNEVKKSIQRDVNRTLKYYDDVANNRAKIKKGYTGDPDMAQVRVKGKNLMRRQDLPESLRKMMGEEDNAYVRMVTSVTNIAQMNANFTMIYKLNEISRESGMGPMILRPMEYSPMRQVSNNPEIVLTPDNLTGFAITLGLIDSDMNVQDLMKQQGFKDIRQAQDFILDFFQDNYTVVNDKRSPMDGKAVSNEFLSMVKQTPMYQANGDDLRSNLLQGYYNTLLQMRKVRVLYNLPTWRKNIMGGWYFLAANGIFGYNQQRGGFTVMKDLKNRLKKIKTGETDPEIEVLLEKVGELGLLGASLNAALVGDINDSYYDMGSGGDPNTAWAWLPKYLQETQKKLGTKSSRIAYQYGFIDDYTKLIAYLSKRENFAKRLTSNPEGKSYSELTAPQQQEVDLAVVERIKQNFPTMSRISPMFRNIMSLPFGDFLSFRVEAFRSFFSIYLNAINDLKEGISNNNLTESQRNAFMLDGFRSLSMGIAMSTMSASGYKFILNQFLDDEEDIELSDDVRGVNYVLPPWMVGSNIMPVSMKEDGTMRFINISSEDPYDEMQGLIYGRKGISRSESLISIGRDFSDPNLAVSLLTNLIKGQNSYGAPIVRNQDATWFNRWIIGSTLSDWSSAYGSYIFKEMFIPPNINYVSKQVRKRLKEAEENPDAQLDPISTALQLGTSLVFRDYPVNIGKQFYYNLEDQNFFTPYSDLSKREKFNRKVRLNEIKTAYDFIRRYGNKNNNVDIIRSASRSIKNKFRKSRAEQLYLLYDMDLPE